MKKYIKYLVVAGIGLAITFLVVLSKNIFSQTETNVIYHILSDGFFVSGVLITGIGLLIFTSNQGSFDMIIYGIQSFFNKFRKDMMARKYKTFYDYKEAKKDRKKGFGYICIVGVCFIILSGIFILLMD